MDEISLLSTEDINICDKKMGKRNKILFGIMLAYFKTYIKFPSTSYSIPLKLFVQVMQDLELQESVSIDFIWNGRTIERYRNEIRNYLGYREAIDSDTPKFVKHLVKTVLPHNPSDALLAEQVRTYFQSHRIEQFKEKQLERYIIAAKNQFEQQFLQSIYDTLSSEARYLIDQTLTTISTDITNGVIELSELKRDVPGARLKNVEYALAKIEVLSKVSIPQATVINIDRKLLLKYYDRIMILSPSNILEFSPIAKYAIMAIFFHVRLQIMLDFIADTFIKLVHRMRTKADRYVDNQILKDVKRVDGKLDILKKLAIVTFDYPKDVIEDKVYAAVSREKLSEVIDDLRNRGVKWYERQVQAKIHINYVHGNRKILLKILRALSFKEDHADYKPIVQAIVFINKHWDESDGSNYLTMPPIEGVIPTNWESMVISVVEEEEVKIINKYNYEIAVLEQLKVLLGYKAVWIQNSYRYRDPNEDLPRDFEQKKQEYYKMLGLPISAKKFTADLKKSLREHLKSLNTNIIDNDLVKIKASYTNRNITVSPSEAQQEPENIDLLQKEIIKRWSSINLIDILKECDLLIDFTKQMETIARSSNIRPDDLRKRLLLCLYGIGSNTGLKRISIANGDVKHSDLRYVKKRFINKTNVRDAIRSVINSVLAVRDVNIWGEATTTVACDSTQISAWDQNLINEWHNRYKGKGVMIYWHVDTNSLCIYSQLKSCSSSEVGAMLKGIIDHDTAMNMNRVFVDTHGQSVIGFAVSYLLGFNLLPRFKNINKQKVYGTETKDKQKYKNIAHIIKGTINCKLIEDNYNEAVKHMVALHLGTIEPSVLVKRLSKDNYQHPVYKALLEIGKASKSIFLCEYLETEALRVEISEGLNVVERLNHVMDFIFYGKLGEMKTNNTEDQELSVLCLHLLQSCMVYVNHYRLKAVA